MKIPLSSGLFVQDEFLHARDPTRETSAFDALVKALRVVCWRAVSVEKYSLGVELSGEMIGLILHRHDLGHLERLLSASREQRFHE